MFHKKLLAFIWKLFFLSLPFSFIAFPILGENYPAFGIPDILIIVVSFLSIINSKVNKKILYVFLFVIYSLIVTLIFRDAGFSFVPSLLMFIVVLLPIVTSQQETLGVHNVIKIGLTISFLFGIYDLVCIFFHSNNLLIELPYSIKQGGVFREAYLISRISSGFIESSWYSYYLVFTFIYLDKKNESSFFRYATVVFIFVSLSLSGLILFFAYLASKINFKSIKFRFTNRSRWASFVVIIYLLFAPNNISYIYTRLKLLPHLVMNPQFNTLTSESTRISGMLLPITYFKENSISRIMFGEGFSLSDTWIIKRFRGNKNEFGRGIGVPNTSLLLIGSGIIGSILYLIMITVLLRKFREKKLLVFVLIFYLTTGLIISSLTWLLFYYFIFVTNYPKNEFVKNKIRGGY